jgi:DNA-binding HxlR family transcriptional regulator
LTRFEEFHSELPVATNILSDRLRFLVREGVFEQIAYQQKPVRYSYQLTPMGKDLLPWFLALLRWGDLWCAPNALGPPMIVMHDDCGQELKAQVRCSQCRQELKAHEVNFALDSAVA